jgi:glutaredoxin 3
MNQQEIDLRNSNGKRQILRLRRRTLMRPLRLEFGHKNGRRETVPQIFIGETHVGGCDDLMALDAKGGLMPLLQA